jgi:hypothetical protein
MIAISTKLKNPKNRCMMKQRPASNADDKPLFWRRQRNAELDRSGDILLASLEDIRKEANSRGDSR